MHDDYTPAQPAGADLDERALRKKAVWRSLICPGAGFALFGRRRLAAATFVSSFTVVLAIAWLVTDPSYTALGALVGSFAIALVLGVAEQVAVKRMSPPAAPPRFLTAGFVLAAAAAWLAAAVVLVLFFTRYGSLQLAGGGMSPTLVKGERLLYEKRVDPERLRRGAVIIYRLSGGSAWGRPGWLMVSRILAVPGDRLSIREGRYLVNGGAGPAVGVTDPHQPVIDVPPAPESVTVPEGRYFIVQDSPQEGFDSRVLSWVEGDDVVATKLYYLSGRGLLEPVE
jgi:signal peptidase I